jgi:hypothetical protein
LLPKVLPPFLRLFESGGLSLDGASAVAQTAANAAQGGDGGGNGFGGGAYIANGSTATFTDTLITPNFALAGSAGGLGIGGGLYFDPSSGTVTLSGKSKVVGNMATTSNNDIYGTYQS